MAGSQAHYDAMATTIAKRAKVQACFAAFVHKAPDTGSMTVRFDGATLIAEASDGDPTALSYSFSTAEGCDR